MGKRGMVYSLHMQVFSSFDLSLVSFLSTDGIHLPGLLYKPKKKTKKVAVWIHGNGSSSIFYSTERMNTFGEIFAHQGVAFFPFNNRGAHILKTLKKEPKSNDEEERVLMGAAMERIEECVYDIDGAVTLLQHNGYEDIILLGHSSGANKICVYHRSKPKNPVIRYVLIAGGDDTGLYYQQMGEQKFRSVLHTCRQKVKEGRGGELVPMEILPYTYSYRALYDIIDPDGAYNIFPFLEYRESLGLSRKDLFSDFVSLSKPTQVIYGEEDEYCVPNTQEVVSILQQHTKGRENFFYRVIPRADHGFTGMSVELARSIDLRH